MLPPLLLRYGCFAAADADDAATPPLLLRYFRHVIIFFLLMLRHTPFSSAISPLLAAATPLLRHVFFRCFSLRRRMPRHAMILAYAIDAVA